MGHSRLFFHWLVNIIIIVGLLWVLNEISLRNPELAITINTVWWIICWLIYLSGIVLSIRTIIWLNVWPAQTFWIRGEPAVVLPERFIVLLGSVVAGLVLLIVVKPLLPLAMVAWNGFLAFVSDVLDTLFLEPSPYYPQRSTAVVITLPNLRFPTRYFGYPAIVQGLWWALQGFLPVLILRGILWINQRLKTL